MNCGEPRRGSATEPHPSVKYSALPSSPEQHGPPDLSWCCLAFLHDEAQSLQFRANVLEHHVARVTGSRLSSRENRLSITDHREEALNPAWRSNVARVVNPRRVRHARRSVSHGPAIVGPTLSDPPPMRPSYLSTPSRRNTLDIRRTASTTFGDRFRKIKNPTEPPGNRNPVEASGQHDQVVRSSKDESNNPELGE